MRWSRDCEEVELFGLFEVLRIDVMLLCVFFIEILDWLEDDCLMLRVLRLKLYVSIYMIVFLDYLC